LEWTRRSLTNSVIDCHFPLEKFLLYPFLYYYSWVSYSRHSSCLFVHEGWSQHWPWAFFLVLSPICPIFSFCNSSAVFVNNL
jgi:hypothetical protein